LATVADQRGGPVPMRMAVIGMGRFGGSEQGYGSDADVLFVHDPRPGATDSEAAQAAHDVANELRRLLALPAPDPPLDVDADLRPEGRQGPLTRSLASYVHYYARWSSVWEAQALLRARAVAGDPAVGAVFLEQVDPLRYPQRGLSESAVREIRRIKARVEAERLPRGADPTLHTKLGRGGLADVEWTVQLLQLRHGHRLPELRTTSTLDAIDAARAADLLAEQDADALARSWQLATRVRNAIVLARGRPAESLPSAVRELASVARAVGYPAGHGADLVEDYRRITRRARAVVERTFYA
jgi:glutamate-ammonia-ligase adenylyltransferase